VDEEKKSCWGLRYSSISGSFTDLNIYGPGLHLQLIPMIIHVIDNGSQWTHREWRQLKDLGVESRILPNTTSLRELGEVEGVILSGGAARVSFDQQNLSGCASFLSGELPVLGICAGHQFMALHFGGHVVPSTVPEFGATEIKLKESDALFDGIPESFSAWTSHNDEVEGVPDGFKILASSSTTLVQAMRHITSPLFGIQFHPEVNHTEFGERIFQNFVRICEQHKEGKEV